MVPGGGGGLNLFLEEQSLLHKTLSCNHPVLTISPPPLIHPLSLLHTHQYSGMNRLQHTASCMSPMAPERSPQLRGPAASPAMAVSRAADVAFVALYSKSVMPAGVCVRMFRREGGG